jgi:tripartite-type tricarboxylate transporter receptor subunit TctC
VSSISNPQLRQTLRGIAGLALSALALGASPLQAQDFPNRPVKLVVPFPAGGATDVFARAVSQKLGDKLGTTIVVDNKPGAGGSIGASLAANSPPDGYTLLLATGSTHSVAPNIGAKLPYDVVRDFTPISHVGNSPSILLVPKDSPSKSVKEFLDHARKNPGKLNYAASGNGTTVHLGTELLKAQAGVHMVHIPYRGIGLAYTDLTSGKIDVMFDALPSGLPHVKDGRLKALGISSAKRSALLPELPAIAETVPGFDSVAWFGLYGPRGLAPELVTRINQAINQALQEPEVKSRLAQLGIEPAGGTPEQFAAMAEADRAKWKKIITERKLSAD